MTDAREQALAWRIRLSEGDVAEGLEAWLAEDPAHERAWREVQGLWGAIGDQASSPEGLAARQAALGHARRSGRRRWLGPARRPAIAAGIALVAVGAALTGGWIWRAGQPHVYETALGERRVVSLADGSKLSLDSGARVLVAYSERARDLTLVRGQARFDVAKDVERPFSVRARDQKVVATGTAFNIDLMGPRVLITLIEGKVVVLDKAASAPRSIELRSGQRLVVAPARPPAVEPASLERTTAWQNGQLVFDNEPLVAIAERVGRYAERPIVIADPQAGALTLSGVFNAGDVDAFLTTVTAYLPVRATTRADGAIELRSKAGAAS